MTEERKDPNLSGELLLVPYGNGDWSVDFFISEKHPDYSGTTAGVLNQEKLIKLLTLLQVKTETVEEIAAIDFEHDQLRLFEVAVGPISSSILLRSHLINYPHQPANSPAPGLFLPPPTN